MRERVFAAVDIGASGGRVIAGVVAGEHVALHVVHRFPNGCTSADGHLRWNLSALYEHVVDGLSALAREWPSVESIGIDTWAVDYGLLDADGDLLAEPIAYRDDRTAAVIDDVHRAIEPTELYRINGLQFLPFNTIYQLAAEQRGELWPRAKRVVLLPDLLGYWLTGVLRTETTNASTTGLLDVASGLWSSLVLDRLRIDPSMLPPLEDPGTLRGELRPEVAQRTGMSSSVVVTTVGSHDTASAVVGVPATDGSFAYIASGTWSLVGLELDQPVVSAAARAANFTNEGGVDGRTRFLRNVGGLWLLQESIRTWEEEGRTADLTALLDAAARVPDGGPTVDVDDPAFIAPGDMPARVAAAAGRSTMTPAETTRCVLDSLAHGYAATLRAAGALAGVDIDTIHVVGGGSQNDLLCRLTARACGLPVVAGPVEATAIGNVVVQARAHGALEGDLAALRAVIAASVDLRRYEPG